MNSEFVEKALEDLEGLNEEQLRAVRGKVKELEESPAGEDSRIIRVAGREIYRAKVKKGRDTEIDHRIIYDIRDDRILIYSVIDRDEGYEKEDLEGKNLKRTDSQKTVL